MQFLNAFNIATLLGLELWKMYFKHFSGNSFSGLIRYLRASISLEIFVRIFEK